MRWSILNGKKLNSIPFYEVFKNEFFKGYKAGKIIFTTYSLDFNELAKILKSIPGGMNLIGDDFKNGTDSIRIYYDYRKLANNTNIFSQELSRHTKAIKIGGAFHPKLYLVEFIRGDNIKYLLIVCSKNISSDNSLEAFVALKGEITNMASNGKSLSDYLASIDRNDYNFLDNVKFSLLDNDGYFVKEVTFPLCNEDRLQEIIYSSSASNPMIIFTPFITDRILDNTKNICVISKECELRKISKPKGKNVNAYIINQCFADNEIENDENSIPSLHAKIYCKLNETNDSVLYLGSANLTSSAFKENKEFITKIVFKGNSIYEQFKSLLNEEYEGKKVLEPFEDFGKRDKDNNDRKKCDGIFSELYDNLKIEFNKISNKEYKYEYKYFYKTIEIIDDNAIEIGEDKVCIKIEPRIISRQTATYFCEFIINNDKRYFFNMKDKIYVGNDVFEQIVSDRIKIDLEKQKRLLFSKKIDPIYYNSKVNNRTVESWEETVPLGDYELIKRICIDLGGDKERIIKRLTYISENLILQSKLLDEVLNYLEANPKK